MELQRAKEILNSPENIEVIYNHEKVWIHNLDTQGDSAEISFLNTPEQKEDVPVRKLKEGNERGLQ